MSRVTAILFLLFIPLFFVNSVLAVDPYATGSAAVSATVVSTTFNPPVLISPNDNSTTNNTREPLIWKRPSPLPSTPLHHYDVYLDGSVFAYSVSDSISTPVTYYSYTVRRTGDTFYLEFLTDLTQGYHTWSVTVYDNSGTNASSVTRTFYVDSVAPYIRLEKVEKQTLNWDTRNSSSIPSINKRSLSVSTANPLLSGGVEPYANMQIVLLCPQNILHCQNQTWQGNYPSGIWQHRFYGLIKGLVYTVYISATDAGGNSTIFPEFYLAYGITAPVPTVTIVPSVSIIPTIPGVIITPTPTPEIEIIPTPFIPAPPVSPTPPKGGTLVKAPQNIITSSWFLIILVLGLPIHILMSIYGTKTSFFSIFKFIYILLFPFFGKKEYQTVPFASIDMFDPDKLDSPWQEKTADVKGFYGLISPAIKKIFVKITAVGRNWKNAIITGSDLPNMCLFPILADPKIGQDRLQLLSMKFRSLPLLIACLTSGYAMAVRPGYFFLIYLYLSIQFSFSEYLYPRL